MTRITSENSQTQDTRENSISNQANGDISQKITLITNNGVSSSEVVKICLELFNNNFLKLEEIAQQKARKEVESYSEILYLTLVNEMDSHFENKLKEPEVQAAINDTVKIVARKGQRSNKELLSEIIKDKILKFENEEESGIIDDAIEAMAKISKSHLILFSITHAIRTLSIIINGKSFREHEGFGFDLREIPPHVERDDLDLPSRRNLFSEYAKRLYAFQFDNHQVFNALNIDGIQPINIELLQSRGLLETDKSYNVKTKDLIMSHWGGDGKDDVNEIIPNLSSIMKKLGFTGIEDIDNIILSPVARYIGDSYLSSRVKIIKS